MADSWALSGLEQIDRAAALKREAERRAQRVAALRRRRPLTIVGVMVIGSLAACILPSGFVGVPWQIVAHGLILLAALAMILVGLRRAQTRDLLVIAACGAVAFGGLVRALLVNQEGFFNEMRFTVLAPCGAVLFGYYAIRFEFKWYYTGLLAAAIIGLITMTMTVLFTPSVEIAPGKWVGGSSRLYIHILSSNYTMGPVTISDYCLLAYTPLWIMRRDGTRDPRGVLMIILAVIAIGLGFATGTRTYVVGYAAIFGFYAAARGWRHVKLWRSGLPRFLLVAAALAGAAIFLELPADFFEKASRFKYNLLHLTGREAIWLQSLQQMEYEGEVFGIPYADFISSLGMSSHNQYIDLVRVLGFGLGLPLVAAIAYIGIQAVLSLTRKNTPLAEVVLALSVLFVHLIWTVNSPFLSCFPAFLIMAMLHGSYLSIYHKR